MTPFAATAAMMERRFTGGAYPRRAERRRPRRLSRTQARDACGPAGEDAGAPSWLHRDRRFDRGVRVVVLEREVAELELEDRSHLGIETHRRQRARVARELFAGLIDVVE